MDIKAIAQDIKTTVLYSGRHDGAVIRIAELTGLSRRTVYDYFDGTIKMTLDFIKAAVIATDGDPEIKKHLEIPGWELVRKVTAVAPKSDLEKELGDVSISASMLHQKVRDAVGDGNISRNELAEIKKLAGDVSHQLAEVMAMVAPDENAKLRKIG